MGGLKNKMPITFWTFLIGTLALCGVWPLSGFYSKDSILAQALEQKNYLLFAVGAGVAGLTTFYMFRLFFVAFLGAPRTEKAKHAHESPAVMSWPLLVLAVFAVIGGVIGINEIFNSQFTPDIAGGSFGQRLVEPFAKSPVGAIVGLVILSILLPLTDVGSFLNS